MAFLENESIRLRAPEKTDLELLYNWENNTSMWCYGSSVAPYSKHVLEQYLENAHVDIFEAKQLRLMIDLKNTPIKTIGAVDLFDFDVFNNRAGVGILIADASDRGKGWASEALKLTIEYSFKLLGFNQLYCNIAATNTASLNFFEKHGFEKVGLKKSWTRRGSKYEDEYLYQLLNID